MPTWIRSSISTLAGSLAIIWCARRRTSGLYCLSVALRSSWPLAVYMVDSGDSVVACGARRRVRGGRVETACRRQRRRASAALARPGGAAPAVGGSSRSPAGSIAAQSCSTRAEEAVGAGGELRGDALGARRARRGAEQQVEHHQAGALRQQLHRGVGVGHAGRTVVGQQDRAAAESPASAAVAAQNRRHSSAAPACTSTTSALAARRRQRARRKPRVEPRASTKRSGRPRAAR